MLTRRDLLQSAAHLAIGAAVAGRTARAAAAPTYCFFSKHLPDLGWTELGAPVKDAGFEGIDLTVRTGGHVLPARAADDLPRAIEAIRARGVSVPMVTTELTSATDPTARPILTAAARSGVTYFKPGYWRFTNEPDVQRQVKATIDAMSGLAALGAECGMQMGFHNHAAYIGAALWDVAPGMDRLDAKWAGYYFDPRHAVAEGGAGAWKAAANLAAPRLKMVAIKDFYWAKGPKGWAVQDCPLGEGQVDWQWVGAWLRRIAFSGPISLHFEYEIPGATAAERTQRTLQAARKDLAFARAAFAEASQPPKQ